MGRAPCCDKANVKKGPWSPEEDAKLKAYIEQHGTGGNWIALPQKIGLKRCGKSCRLRWLNYLRPNIRHGGFSEEEDNIICSLYISIGSRWSIIAAQLPGRTDNDIKNYWNTRLKKQLLGKQRKELQAQACHVASQKQEMKREIQNSNMPAEGVANPVPSWTVGYNPTVAMPSMDFPNHDYPFDQTSMKNLLIKLGGRFSVNDHPQQSSHSSTLTTSTNWQYNPRDANSFPPHQLYEIPMNVANSVRETNTTNDDNSGQSENAFPAMNDNFPDEWSHLNDTQPIQRDDVLIERYFAMEAMDMVNASSNMTTSTESGSWGDMSMSMSSLVHSSPLESYYAACQQGIPQDFAFDEPRYLVRNSIQL